ncbi:hypothetical protein GCM10028803_61700 [Larkinella knui]|uniref:histidine kinase n=1 Tax=Larkinella knui TaxID=2025310 RepID=A0A3P1CAZ2_9BACT|nr:tetratricopeptide repeat protein [Larkinella knui]RRB10501.1 histidine kinase [Larkinella knui]
MKTLHPHFLFLLLVIIIASRPVFAQPARIDSLLTVLKTQKKDTNRANTLSKLIGNYQRNNEPEKAIQTANEMLALANLIGSEKFRIEAYYQIGMTYFYNRINYETTLKSWQNFLLVLPAREKSGNKWELAWIYYYLGATDSQLNNLPDALNYLYKALRLARETGNQALAAEIYYFIGGIFLEQKQYPEALTNLLESLRLRKIIGHQSDIAHTLTPIAQVYMFQRDFAKAFQYTQDALQIVQQPGFDGPNWMVPLNYRTLGEIYESMGEAAHQFGDEQEAAKLYTKALENFQTSLADWKKLRQTSGVAEVTLLIGNIHRKLNRQASARDYLERGLKAAIDDKYLQSVVEGYRFLSKLDSAQGNYRQAYQNYKAHIVFRDSLFNQEKTQKLTEVKMQYEFDKKMALAKAEQEKKDLLGQRAITRQYAVMTLLAILVVVVTLIAFIQWRNNRQKQRTNAVLLQQKAKIEETLNHLKTTQTQLVQKEKMASLGELTAGIAHEIQNPLNFVTNFSELSSELVDELEEERQKSAHDPVLEVELLTDLKDNLGKILHHGQRASSIVKGMLEHARSSTGEQRPTDLNGLVDEYLRLAYQGQRANDKSFNCKLQTAFDPAIGEVNLIPQEIGRVLLNLFSNAFYAVHQQQQLARNVNYQPEVVVQTSRQEKLVIITVHDNGTGIPDSVKSKIFQPFFTTKPTGQGTGLGLSLSHDIVTKGHGGHLSVSSQEGQGTEFTLSLPIPSADA